MPKVFTYASRFGGSFFYMSAGILLVATKKETASGDLLHFKN